MATDRGANILDAITQLSPLLLGSGKTKGTQTVSKNGNADAIAALTGLLQNKATDPNAAKGIVSDAQKNAIQLMLQAGVPQIGAAERGSGIYNASQTAQAMSQLEGQTAAAAAKMEVDQVNKAAEAKTQAASALGQMSSTETATTSQKTAPVIDPVMAALGLGGMFLGNSLLKGKGGILDMFNSGGNTGPGINTPDFTPVTKSPDLGSMLDLGGFTTSIASSLKNATFDPVSGQQNTGGGKEFVSALESVGTSSLLSGLTSIFSGLFGGGGSSSGSSSSSGDTGTTFGCFITTAVCEYMGKADDCVELQTLRNFRDSYMQEHYPELIAQYYKEAPAIVASLANADTTAKGATYKFFYEDYIVPAIDAIREQDYQYALEIYTDLFHIASRFAAQVDEEGGLDASI